MRETQIAQRQQTRQQGDSRHDQRQSVQRRRHRESALENFERQVFDEGLIDKADKPRAHLRPQIADQSRDIGGRDAQRKINARRPRPVALERVDVDAQLSVGIAVIGIDTDNARGPVFAFGWNVQRVAHRELQAPRQLLARQNGVASRQKRPHVRVVLQQRKMLGIGLVGFKRPDFHRPMRDLRLGSKHRQNRLHVRPLRQPCLDARSGGVIARLEIDLGDQPVVQPAREGHAKALDHRADADIGRERQQQSHQSERQAGQLLAAVRPKPARHRAFGEALA